MVTPPMLATEEPLAAVRMATTSGGFVLLGNQRASGLDVIDARDSSGHSGGAAPTGHRVVGVINRLSRRDGTACCSGAIDSHSDCATGGNVLPARPTHRCRRESFAQTRAAVRAPRAVDVWRESHEIECLPVSGAPLPQPQVLRVEREVRIDCWRAAGERLLLYDSNHKQLQSLECALHSGVCGDNSHAVTRSRSLW